MASVSVIIPNFNRAEIIGETITNMLAQSLKPFEIIVVDDGSTDNSIEVIKSFGNEVKLIQQSNKGPGAARNAGLKLATGEFIQFMDSDDLASLNKLEVQAKTLVETDADIVYGPWVKAWIQQKEVRLENVVLQQKALPPSRSPLLWFLTSWSMVFQQCLVRKSILDRVGGYREDMKSLEDGDLFVRLLLNEAKLVYEGQSLTLYRLDDYGKLTASGHEQEGRAKDHLKYYDLLLNYSKTYPALLKYIKFPEFQLGLWEAVSDVKDSQVIKSYPNLFKIKSKNPLFEVRRWLKVKKGGLKQRLAGHRWPASYQPGRLTTDQKELIQEMGWKVSA